MVLRAAFAPSIACCPPFVVNVMAIWASAALTVAHASKNRFPAFAQSKAAYTSGQPKCHLATAPHFRCRTGAFQWTGFPRISFTAGVGASGFGSYPLRPLTSIHSASDGYQASWDSLDVSPVCWLKTCAVHWRRYSHGRSTSSGSHTISWISVPSMVRVSTAPVFAVSGKLMKKMFPS